MDKKGELFERDPNCWRIFGVDPAGRRFLMFAGTEHTARERLVKLRRRHLGDVFVLVAPSGAIFAVGSHNKRESGA